MNPPSQADVMRAIETIRATIATGKTGLKPQLQMSNRAGRRGGHRGPRGVR